MSLKSVKDFFESSVLIFNLSAPGAAKLEKPLALSYSWGSSLAVIICSSIVNPTLYDGYWL